MILLRVQPLYWFSLLLLATVTISAFPVMAQLAREPAQFPSGEDPLPVIYPPDLVPDIPGSSPGNPTFQGSDFSPHDSQLPLGGLFMQKLRSEQLGGDEVLVYNYPGGGAPEYDQTTAYDSYGNGYCARNHETGTGPQISVYRSTDNGLTWSLWGAVSDPDPSVRYQDGIMIIAEGDQDRCFVACSKYSPAQGYFRIVVCHADIGAASAVFTEVVAIDSPGENIWDPDLASDAPNFTPYYLYLTARSPGVDHDKIWFTRSIDEGDSWETEYTIAELPAVDRDYYNPQLAYGFNGKIHVVWGFWSSSGAFDAALRYRRADSYASGGSSSWGVLHPLSSTSDGYVHYDVEIASSLSGDEVLIATNFIADSLEDYAAAISSTDQGASWPYTNEIETMVYLQGLAWQPGTSSWILQSGGPGGYITRASTSDPSTWSELEAFYEGWPEGSDYGRAFPFALNPARDYRIGAFWHLHFETGSNSVFHDGEWFNDPGWPVEEEDSPVALLDPPLTAPAIVDLDGDGDLEIVFSDTADQIQALHDDGTPVAGWPVSPGEPLSVSPVAVGDINGDAIPEVAAGAVNGKVYLYDPTGTLIPGWPVNTISANEVHVSIGALGPPYTRVVVACAGFHAEAFNWRGAHPPGFVFHETPELLNHPAAIGDMNGDGLNELVIAGANWVGAYHPLASGPTFSRDLPASVSDAPTLGDLDGDGDVEAFIPTLDGIMYALDDDGLDLTGWPYDTGTPAMVSSASLAHCLGGFQPEIAFSLRGYGDVHLVHYDGGSATGYPVSATEAFYIFADPIIGHLAGTSADLVVGARDWRIWSWDNFGNLLDGWPRDAGHLVHQTAAMGDIDLDGRTELVVLTQAEMRIFDLNRAPGPSAETWPMQGNDPRRSGCWECPEDLVTGVEAPNGYPVTTRVNFRMVSANPASGHARFQFSLPERAAVSLEIYDVRGHRIKTVARAEAPMGVHLVDWDGRDGEGRSVASGQYLARLKIRGPSLEENMVRKVSWVR